MGFDPERFQKQLDTLLCAPEEFPNAGIQRVAASIVCWQVDGDYNVTLGQADEETMLLQKITEDGQLVSVKEYAFTAEGMLYVHDTASSRDNVLDVRKPQDRVAIVTDLALQKRLGTMEPTSEDEKDLRGYIAIGLGIIIKGHFGRDV